MRRLLIGAGFVAFLVVAYGMVFSRDGDHVRTTRMGRFTLVERVHVTRHPFIHLAESGRDAYIPIPYANEEIVGQRLVVNDTTVWIAPEPDGPYFADPSPDGSMVVMRPHTSIYPWRVVHASGAEVLVEIPDNLWRNERGDYPFHFWRWSDDGRTIDAYTRGWRPDEQAGPGVLTSYRRIWRIDPEDGSSEVIAACEQPFSEQPDWRGTDCERLPAGR